MRLTDSAALAPIANARALAAKNGTPVPWVRWWSDVLAPPATEGGPTDFDRLAIEQAFVDRLTEGELVGWARYNSPVAPYARIPADAWPALQGHRMEWWSWELSSIKVMTVTSKVAVNEQRTRSATGKLTLNSRREWYNAQVLKPVETITLQLYSVLIQPLAVVGHAGKSASETRCFEWLSEQMSRQTSKPKNKDAFRKEAWDLFKLGPEGFKRAWDKAVKATGAPWNKPGRLPKSVG
jgi:hypothetical protein